MEKLLLSIVLMVFTLSYTSQNPVDTRKGVKQPVGCVCEKFNCGCCVYMDVPRIRLNDTACINFALDLKGYGISFTLTIDQKALINETISARNPPPVCIPVPVVDDAIHMCVHFYDLAISYTNFHGCVQLEIKMVHLFVLTEQKLGCFDTNNLVKKGKELLKIKSKDEVVSSSMLKPELVPEQVKSSKSNMSDVDSPSSWNDLYVYVFSGFTAIYNRFAELWC